jgi:hypothetical protein
MLLTELRDSEMGRHRQPECQIRFRISALASELESDGERSLEKRQGQFVPAIN